MDLVISWGLTDRKLTLETLWVNFEHFCKPQSNAVIHEPDLTYSLALDKKTN